MSSKSFIERRDEKLKPARKYTKKGIVTDTPTNTNGSQVIVEEKKEQESGVLLELPRLIDQTINHFMNTPQKEAAPAQNEVKELELIESLDFMNGTNKLSIRFSKKHNRMFRIQVFLNDTNEIRPVTYSGASTGGTFWKLLKGILKK